MALQVRLLGKFEVQRDSQRISGFRSHKVESLLAYLVFYRDRAHLRETLTEFFWGEFEESKAKASLRQALYLLREHLGSDAILASQRTVQLNKTLDCGCDAREFEDLLARTREAEPELKRSLLEQAISLYRGDFLSGLYDDWCLREAERFKGLYTHALMQLIESYKALKDYEKAIDYAERALQSNPLQEDIHRELIFLYYAAGDRTAALEQYERCQKLLKRELNVEPLPETTALYKEILAKSHEEDKSRLEDTSSKTVRWLRHYTELSIPFVGRTVEQAKLDRAWREAQAGHGSCVLLLGESGVGKTRLARELVRSVTQDKTGSMALSRCYQMQSNLPYAPLTELFRQMIQVNSKEIAKIPKLWRGELLKILPELGERFSELEPNSALSPDQEQARLFEGLTQVLKIFSQDRALLLFADDWQWADRATLQFFSYLIPRLAQSRLLLLGACRSEEVAGELGALIRQLRHHEAVLDLAGLMELEIKGLVDHLLGAEFSKLSRELRQRTEGHPFFVLEILQSLIHTRQLRPNAQGRWEWAGSSESSLAIPPEVSSVIETRLRRLDESERGVLNAAAVVGRTFDPDFLAAVTGHNNSYLLELLDELRQARLITEEERQYRFDHDLVRTHVYENLNEFRRRVLHQHVGEALEENASVKAVPAGELAYHFERAEVFDKALEYTLQSAEHAQKVYANQEALDAFARAEASMKKLQNQGKQKMLEQHFRLLSGRMSVLNLLGRRAEQEIALQQLRDIATRSKDDSKLAETLVKQSNFYRMLGRVPDARRAGETAIALYEKLQDQRGLSAAWQNLGVIYSYAGEHRQALEAHGRALTLAEAVDDKPSQLSILRNQALTHRRLSNYAQALTNLERARELSRSLSDRHQEGSLWNHTGAVYGAMGEYERVLECCAKACEIAQAIGAQELEGSASQNMAQACTLLGEHRRALELAERAYQIGCAIQDPSLQGVSLNTLGVTYRGLGELAQALSSFEKAYEIRKNAGNRPGEAIALNNIGMALQRLGRFAEALERLETALPLIEQMGERAYLIHNLVYQSQSYLQLGEATKALELSQRAVQLLTELNTHSDAPSVFYAHSLILRANGQETESHEYLQEAYESLMSQANQIPTPERRRRFLEEIQEHRELILEWQKQGAERR